MRMSALARLLDFSANETTMAGRSDNGPQRCTHFLFIWALLSDAAGINQTWRGSSEPG
jgi:hypothetical protein